jgi:hypothetical protein
MPSFRALRSNNWWAQHCATKLRYSRVTVVQASEWGCEGSVVLLDDAAEGEDGGCDPNAEWVADVQHDFMSLIMLPKVCEHLLNFLSSLHDAAA